MKKFNQDFFVSSLEWSCGANGDLNNLNVSQMGKLITEILTRAMD